MSQEGDGSSSAAALNLRTFPIMSTSPESILPYSKLKELSPPDRAMYLIHLLFHSAYHVSSGNFHVANISLDQISYLASPDGDAVQRIAVYYSRSLADRIFRALPGVYKAFNAPKPDMVAEEETVGRKAFNELLPFMRAASAVSNRTIVEAMAGEKFVHVIDLNVGEPLQWCGLIRNLNARPEGPPHLRITGVHQRKEVLDEISKVLIQEANTLNFPFQFNQVVSELENLDVKGLSIKTGEAIAISSTMKLHMLLAPSDVRANSGSPQMNGSNQKVEQTNEGIVREYIEKNHMANGYRPCNDLVSLSPESVFYSPNLYGVLSGLWQLSPKIMVVMEQDSDHNSQNFIERMLTSINFYGMLFDCLALILPRTSAERSKIERMLGEEIKNIVACEGPHRKERHERLENWKTRLDLAGFENVPVSNNGVVQANQVLQQSCQGGECTVREENGSALIYWNSQSLFSVSAWRIKK